MTTFADNGVRHLRVNQASMLSQFLREQGHDESTIESWLYMGCIYIDGRRQRQDTTLATDQFVRLHTRPKRYRAEFDHLKERIVFDDPEFLVVDKPAGLPVHPTLDNYVENAKFILEQELGCPLYSTHRLDVPTEGLLILAKSPRAQALINKIFAERRIEKIYRAVTAKPVPLGEHVLFLNPDSRVPRAHSFTPVDGWWECRLEVLNCETGGAGEQVQIRLGTGRTHQIRAQLSALGSPVCGDIVYGWRMDPEKKYVHERLALECFKLSFTFRSRTLAIERPRSLFPPVPHG